MSLGLKIDMDTVEDKVILRLHGRIDAATSTNLEKKVSSLLDDRHFFLLFDFTRVDYLSSAGMRLLLSLQKKIAKEKGVFVLFSVQDDVFQIIKMAGFEKILTIVSSEEKALQMKP